MRNYAENGELCGIVQRKENCAISHSPHLNVASVVLVLGRTPPMPRCPPGDSVEQDMPPVILEG